MFHLAINRVQTGPISEADVRQRLARGEVHGDDLCWREGWEKWRKVSEVFPPVEPTILPTTPPPLAQALPGMQDVPPLPVNLLPAQSSGLATASMICGICVFVLFPFFFLFAIAAVVMGHVAQSTIKQSGGTIGGGGKAKAGLIMGYIGIAVLPVFVVIGLLAAMAIPAFQKVRQNSQEQTVRNNLAQIWYAAEQQMLETGAETVGYDELVGPEKSLQEESLNPVAGEDYRSLVIRRGDQSISVTLRNGRTIEYYGNSPAGGDVPAEAPTNGTDTSDRVEEKATVPDEAPEPVAPAPEPEALAAWPALA